MSDFENLFENNNLNSDKDSLRDKSNVEVQVAPVRKRRSKAESMATKQRSISVSEFFAKNKQLLGFDSPARALMTTVKEAVDNSESNLPTQEEGFVVSLFTEKEIYQREEPFNLTLNISYDGAPFKAAIIYDSYRKGFSKHFYKGYIENVSSKGINRSIFHAGYPAEKAFRIHDGGYSYPKNFFLDEGTYYISVYVYDCEKIADEGYSCNPSHVFPSTFGISDDTPEDLIKHNVKPIKMT